MIENYNETSSKEYVDVKKFIGVGSISVLAVNPDNATLRKYGWSVADGASEPEYVTTRTDENGKPDKSARVRFLLRINDFIDKPVVAYDIWIRPGYIIGKDSGKCKVIDAYGYTAWATKEDVKAKRIPQYSSGPAQIHSDYKGCHPGQEKLVSFLHKLLNVTPLQVYDNNKSGWTNTANPGRLTIDDWDKLCNGDASEIEQYVSLRPDNVIKVVFGVRTTDENRTYQTILDECDGTRKSSFLSNAQKPDRQTGEYTLARKRIDEFYKNHENATNITYSALPVREWKETATDVKDNSTSMFDNAAPDNDFDNDLPFD